MLRLPPISSLFPYTTLFRSRTLGGSALESRRWPGYPCFWRTHVLLGETHAQGHASPLSLGGVAPFRSDRKSTRLNSSHITISYAVFCLKKKKKKTHTNPHT